ncbi:MAG: carbohydrate ABC transporter permease [Actinobacteria bacterium]|nr:carbohydrate ABC transporter permease [Actinomycetota bacterium]
MSGKTNLSSFINGLWKHLLIVIICISVLFPIYFMVITSVKTQGQYLNNIWAISFPFNFLNFGEAFKGRFLLWFKNSAILTFGSTVLATFFASLMAYAFARLKFRGKNGILSSIISLMVIPPAVIILPIVVLWSKIGLINTYAGAIIVYTGLILPFSVYLLTNFFRTIPTEIIEAAVIDGCSTFQVFRLIVLGLSKPAIFTNIIVNAVWIWNELFVAMILLPNEKMKTLMVGLAVFKTHYNVNVPVIMAGLIIATLPMAVLYLMGQNFLIKGLIVGYGK